MTEPERSRVQMGEAVTITWTLYKVGDYGIAQTIWNSVWILNE